jgi:hypothetical protein
MSLEAFPTSFYDPELNKLQSEMNGARLGHHSAVTPDRCFSVGAESGRHLRNKQGWYRDLDPLYCEIVILFVSA